MSVNKQNVIWCSLPPRFSKINWDNLVSNGQRKSNDIRVIDEFISKHLELPEENLEHTGGHRVRD